jgi:tetratricopeptide (TPR) repeat protein
MKNFILISFIISIAIITSNAQPIESDKIQTALNTAVNKERVDLLNQLSRNCYISSDSAGFMKAYNEALILSRTIGYSEGEIDATNNLALFYSYYDPQKCLGTAQSALQLSKKINYPKGQAAAYLNMGLKSLETDYSGSIENLLESIKISSNNELKSLEANAYTDIGEAYMNMGNFDEALKNYLIAERTFDFALDKDKSLLNLYNYGILMNSFGIVYKNLGKYNEALNYCLKYSEVCIKLRDTLGTGIGYNNIGNVYNWLGKKQEAIDSYQKALNIFNSIGNMDYIAEVYISIGNVLRDQNKLNEADEYYQKALSIFKTSMNFTGLINVYINLGDMYYTKKMLINSEKCYSIALEFALKTKKLDKAMSAYSSLADIYESEGNYKKALEYHKKWTDFKDSINSREMAMDIGSLKTQYEIEKKTEELKRKDAEDQERQQEAINHRYLLEYTGIAILVILLLIITVFFGRLRLWTKIVEAMIFVTFLLMFEFFSVMLDPIIDNLTNSEPVFKLLANIILGVCLSPLHDLIEENAKARILGKNMRKVIENE